MRSSAGHRLVTTESVDPPDLVIVDIARVDPDEVADTYPDTPILGFTNTQTPPASGGPMPPVSTASSCARRWPSGAGSSSSST